MTTPAEQIATEKIAVDLKDVDIIFGKDPASALSLLDSGATREEILDQTDHVIGVADASISIREGEICVLMGLSGSGKSTLLRAVNGLNKVTRGAVLVSDNGSMVDVATCNAATLRRLRMGRVAMVFQQFALLPWRTVEENVGLGLELRGMGKAERTAVVEDKLKLVGLEQWKDKYAHELSGGMQQRVGLARAFCTDADILLMDEPFSALDPLIRNHLQDELLELQTTLKKTIIFVSHDLDEALKIGTHIAIMESGRIVQYGEPEEIVLKPANEYVSEFVAHMNPLNVLRGRSLMTPVETMNRSDGMLQFGNSPSFVVTLNDAGAPAGVQRDGAPCKLLGDDEVLADGGGPAVHTADVEVPMRRVIELREASGYPVLLTDNGRFAGVIGDSEIYRGILRQAGVAD